MQWGGPAALLALVTMAGWPAFADVDSRFAGPYAVDESGDKTESKPGAHPVDGDYIRLDFAFTTRPPDSDCPHVPRAGEEWRITIRKVGTGRTLVTTRLQYDAAADCIRNGAGQALVCGLEPESGPEQHYLMLRYETGCVDKGAHSISVEMSDGSRPPGSPYRFVGTGDRDCSAAARRSSIERVASSRPADARGGSGYR